MNLCWCANPEGVKLESNLKAAYQSTKKGEYHKIQHASKLLALLEVDKVWLVAPQCERLFTTLIQKIVNCQKPKSAPNYIGIAYSDNPNWIEKHERQWKKLQELLIKKDLKACLQHGLHLS